MRLMEVAMLVICVAGFTAGMIDKNYSTAIWSVSCAIWVCISMLPKVGS